MHFDRRDNAITHLSMEAKLALGPGVPLEVFEEGLKARCSV